MTGTYNKIDIPPLYSVEWPPEMEQWLSLITSDLNQFFVGLENGFTFPHKTQAEILELAAEPATADGTGWYCTDSSPPNIVFKIDGSLVQLNTSAFP